MLAERYRDNHWVIGADLRNEIRAIPGIGFCSNDILDKDTVLIAKALA